MRRSRNTSSSKKKIVRSSSSSNNRSSSSILTGQGCHRSENIEKPENQKKTLLFGPPLNPNDDWPQKGHWRPEKALII